MFNPLRMIGSTFDINNRNFTPSQSHQNLKVQTKLFYSKMYEYISSFNHIMIFTQEGPSSSKKTIQLLKTDTDDSGKTLDFTEMQLTCF